MSNISNIPLEDWFSTSLTRSWDWSVWTIYVASTPSFTFPSWITTYIVVNPWKSNMQLATINAYNSSLKTMTVSSITLNKWASVASTANPHSVWSKVIISDNYQFWADIISSLNSKVDWDTQPFPSYTTSWRDALTASNWMVIYNSTTWELNQYISWSWSAISAWSTQPNASETVAGKVEAATSWEFTAGTDTWWTWALLFCIPSLIKAKTDTLQTNITTVQTNLNNKNIISLITWEDITAWQAVYISSWWGSRTVWAVYRASSLTTTYYDMMNFIWFATETITSWNSIKIETFWININQTWLTGGVNYYLTNTPWTISATPWTNIYKIWEWISATSILINKVGWVSAWAWTLYYDWSNKSNNTTTPTKVKEAIVRLAWTYTVKFGLSNQWSWWETVFWQIYKNWSAFWTLQSTTSSSDVTFTEDLNFIDWDLIQLYLYKAWTWNANHNIFSILWQISIPTALLTFSL